MSAESMRRWRANNPERARALDQRMRDERREENNAARRRYNARLYAERRAALDKIKLDAGCADCGYDKHPAALDFDHVRGTKDFGIGEGILHRRWEVILNEIAKCDVVCANCHRIRTAERRDFQDRCIADGGPGMVRFREAG